MARPPRVEVPGALYHVIARGNQRRLVFRDAVDYHRYLELLARYQRRHGFTLYAYALLPNHLHLLISPARLPLAKSMQGLQQAYTRHFNQRHRLVGHCFQGRYKAILCQAEAYLLELVRYLHLNPLRAGLAATVDDYQWTSHPVYLGGRDAAGVSVEAVLQEFSATRSRAVAAYRRFVVEGLPAGHRDDLYAVVAQRFLGDERFVERIERTTLPATPKPAVDVPVQLLARWVATRCGVPEARMRARGRSRDASQARALVAYLGREEAALPLKTVARYFNRDEATLSQAVLRLETQIDVDPRLSIWITGLRRLIRRGSRRKRFKQIMKA